MSVNSKMTAIADAIRGKTGGTTALTLDQMAAEIAGIQTGGGEDTFPQTVFETTFEVENAIASGSSTLCTITTGFEADRQWGVAGEMMVVEFHLDSASAEYTPDDNDVVRSMQALFCDQYNSWASNSVAAIRIRSGTKKTGNVGLYLSSRPNLFGTVTINCRLPNGEKIAPGIYTLKFCRTGVKNA